MMRLVHIAEVAMSSRGTRARVTVRLWEARTHMDDHGYWVDDSEPVGPALFEADVVASEPWDGLTPVLEDVQDALEHVGWELEGWRDGEDGDVFSEVWPHVGVEVTA